MQNWNRFPRVLFVLSLLIGLCASPFAPRVEKVGAKPSSLAATNIVISEFRTRGPDPSAATNEFIELYNPTTSSINISNWILRRSSNCGNTPAAIATIPNGVILVSGQYYLIGGATYSESTIPDIIDSLSIADGGGIALFMPDGVTFVDKLGMCVTTLYVDGNPLNSLTTNINRSYERKFGGTSGHCLDNNNNASDFVEISPSDPQNSSTIITCTVPPTEVVINEVAWMGTVASPNDEWIELHNPGINDVDITGWRLVSDDGNPDIVFNSSTCNPNCIIPSGGYFLLERAHDNVIQGNTANLIFLGQLSDSGETLILTKADATIVDTANSDGGAWPAGIISPASSMERVGTDAEGNLSWSTFQGTGSTFDAGNHLINGTPGFANIMLGITPTFTPSITPSPTNTFTPTPTFTLTPSITPTPAGLRSVIINEIAWAGTASGLSNDEWIELYNPGNTAVDISGWSLSTGDGDPDIIIPPGISISVGGYYLLERDDDNTVSDVAADQIYTGTLSNSGETLTLYDGSNKVIDTANGNGGSWPAGSSSTYGTMERNSGTADSDSAWHTNTGTKKNGENANGGDILGTPKHDNSSGPTPTPARTPTKTRTPTPFPIDPRPIINEILPRPGFDWNQDGRVDVFDEFIEIKNLSPIDINLSGWILGDEENTGSSPFVLPDVTLKPGQRRVFYGLQTNILLSDGGDSVRLIHPNGKIYDTYTYSIAKNADQSICRLPDGNVHGVWYEDCTPTPNLINTRDGVVPSLPGVHYESPVCELPDTLPADFLFAECHGYGENIWNPFYWDQNGWLGAQTIPQNMSKWESIIR